MVGFFATRSKFQSFHPIEADVSNSSSVPKFFLTVFKLFIVIQNYLLVYKMFILFIKLLGNAHVDRHNKPAVVL